MLPDIQTAIEEQIAARSPKLVGVHQRHEFDAMKLSDMVIREGGTVVALTPLQYQDIDVGEDVRSDAGSSPSRRTPERRGAFGCNYGAS
ncbi:hypothetical protein [Mesorhizobium onobrychidis]|uniref:Uncharacterized protein n=1 Tax=Mesorhizobium onobrychidis TaxID=2775404 RepID=A0ABY5R6Z8_9HYPH|nr:hypothetical protein [Mesorhizobium onobrychidis]UVC19280.1 hypothetical protein IHQ72_34200 [Mesorhizobium onobrychidis]